MMALRTKKGRQSYSAGERGRNRVRVFSDPKTGIYQIEWREGGRRLSESLKHRDWRLAKQQADEFAAQYVEPKPGADAPPQPLTLGTLFEMYLEEVTRRKGEHARRHDRRAAKMFMECWGEDRPLLSLNRQDWDRFIRARRSGELRPPG